MSDLKDWCYKNDIEWHTTTTEAFRVKSALEKLWDDEVESKEAQLKIAIAALETIEGGDDNGDCEIAEKALEQIKKD